MAAAAVRQLSEGRAPALAIEGEAGIGQTSLVQGIVDGARSGEVAVFCGQAHLFERTRPFGVVAAALGLGRRSPDPRRAAIGALPAEVARLLDDLAAGGARTLHLRPLKSGDVAVLACHVLGASPGAALTVMLAKAGGNPLWAVAMLRSLADEGMPRRAGDSAGAMTSELPASLSDLVVRRLRRTADGNAGVAAGHGGAR